MDASQSELLRQLMGLSVMPDQQDQMQQQIDTAVMARRRPQQNYTTGAGAALGGLGDIINHWKSKSDEGDLRSQYADLLQRKQGLRAKGREAEMDAAAFPGSQVMHAQMVQPDAGAMPVAQEEDPMGSLGGGGLRAFIEALLAGGTGG